MKNPIIKNTLILTAITLGAGLLLGAVYEITKQPIATSQENAKQEAYKEVFVDATDFVASEIFDYDNAIAILEDAGLEKTEITEVVVASNGSEDLGYVITVTSKEGYGGNISFTMGVKNDGTLNGISVLSISETAGLGMKAAEEGFKNQFKDKLVPQFAYTKSGATSDEEIDAISGATITTSAMVNGVNAGLIYFQSELGGSGNE